MIKEIKELKKTNLHLTDFAFDKKIKCKIKKFFIYE